MPSSRAQSTKESPSSAHICTTCNGYFPTPEVASLFVEIGPGMAIHRLVDTAQLHEAGKAGLDKFLFGQAATLVRGPYLQQVAATRAVVSRALLRPPPR